MKATEQWSMAYICLLGAFCVCLPHPVQDWLLHKEGLRVDHKP